LERLLGRFPADIGQLHQALGLLRRQLADGRYERTLPNHGWNSNHMVSNLAVFHLQRHIDHHAYPTRVYQSLPDFDDVPALPSGYFGMFLIAYMPPPCTSSRTLPTLPLRPASDSIERVPERAGLKRPVFGPHSPIGAQGSLIYSAMIWSFGQIRGLISASAPRSPVWSRRRPSRQGLRANERHNPRARPVGTLLVPDRRGERRN
jgi:hypothetical protein